jgi:hypothetical protein
MGNILPYEVMCCCVLDAKKYWGSFMKVYAGSSLDPYFTCRYGFGDIFGSGECYG